MLNPVLVVRSLCGGLFDLRLGRLRSVVKSLHAVEVFRL